MAYRRTPIPGINEQQVTIHLLAPIHYLQVCSNYFSPFF
ncbi:hypothetical protein KSS87_004450 [Heliosperma pusillum]|nr:hypothetical protein KSS87_014527 [Heliosperma pusillum]KAH9612437.1 hypothetical protein KSS87_004450 [Heliosperma pusillum]